MFFCLANSSNLKTLISTDEFRNLDSLLSVSGAGPTVFISSDSKKLLKNAYNDLKSINNANIYWKNKIPKRFHYRSHVRIPDILVLANEGWSLMPLGHGSYNPKGSHGYDNMLDNMKAIFIANGPSFKSGSFCLISLILNST